MDLEGPRPKRWIKLLCKKSFVFWDYCMCNSPKANECMKKGYLGKETSLGLRLISNNPFLSKSEGLEGSLALS